MKDYASMSDIEIDTMVSKICSPEFHRNYCNNPADAWPIITENRIGVIPAPEHGAWRAAHRVIGEDSNPRHFTQHANPLRAAMIVFLKMKDGE